MLDLQNFLVYFQYKIIIIQHMKRILFVCIFSLFASVSFGQEFLKGKDLSQVKAAQFSDAEISQIGKELKANQMTLEQAEPLALAKGMSASEFAQLKVRLQSNGTVPAEVKEEQKKAGAVITQDGSVLAAKNIVAFGSELFTTKSLSFEPNQNMPTPPNYVLGPGDQLDINVYGVQQFGYSATISKNGTVNIPNVGEVFLSGLAFEAAKNKLQKQIGRIY